MNEQLNYGEEEEEDNEQLASQSESSEGNGGDSVEDESDDDDDAYEEEFGWSDDDGDYGINDDDTDDFSSSSSSDFYSSNFSSSDDSEDDSSSSSSDETSDSGEGAADVIELLRAKRESSYLSDLSGESSRVSFHFGWNAVDDWTDKDVEDIKEAAESCTNIKTVTIDPSRLDVPSAAVVGGFVSFFTSLEELEIQAQNDSEDGEVVDRLLQVIASEAHFELKAITLCCCGEGSAVTRFLSRFSNVESVAVGGPEVLLACPEAFLSDVSTGIRHLPSLKRLSLHCDGPLTADSLSLLYSKPNLLSLSLSIANRANSIARLSSILSASMSLEKVWIQCIPDDDGDDESDEWEPVVRVGCTPTFWESMYCHRALKSVELSSFTFLDLPRNRTPVVPMLTSATIASITFDQCRFCGLSTLSPLRGFRALTSLTIRDCLGEGLSNASLWKEILLSLSSLERLVIQKVDYAWDVVPNIVLTSIAKAIQIHPTLTAVEIPIAGATNDEFTATEDSEEHVALELLLKHARGLLVLNGFRWPRSYIGYVMRGLRENVHLKSLDLVISFNEFNEEDATALFNCIGSNQVLEQLHISSWGTLEHSNPGILHLLQSNASLRVLSLKGFAFGRPFIESLAKGLEINRTLEKLHLSDWSPTEADWLACISDALSRGVPVEELTIGCGEDLPLEGFERFVHFLKTARDLKCLTCFPVLFVNTGWKAEEIMEVVARNKVLQHVHGFHFSDGYRESEDLFQHYLTMNRYGRRFLNSSDFALGLWPHVLARVAVAKEATAVLFDFLKRMPSLAGNRGIRRQR